MPAAAILASHQNRTTPSTIPRYAASIGHALPLWCWDLTGVPSASIAVVQHGKLVYTHAYGSARLATATSRPLRARRRCAIPSDRFPSSSRRQRFCCLQEQANLKLDDAVGKYVPGLTRGNEVTIREILSHTAGYQDYWPENYVMTTMTGPRQAQQISTPGAKSGWTSSPEHNGSTRTPISSLQAVSSKSSLERATGISLSSTSFVPLGMKSVWNSDQQELTPADATAYYRHALGLLRAFAPRRARAGGCRRRTGHDAARPGALG